MTVEEIKKELCKWDGSLPVCIIANDGLIKNIENVQGYEDDDPTLPGRIVFT